MVDNNSIYNSDITNNDVDTDVDNDDSVINIENNSSSFSLNESFKSNESNNNDIIKSNNNSINNSNNNNNTDSIISSSSSSSSSFSVNKRYAKEIYILSLGGKPVFSRSRIDTDVVSNLIGVSLTIAARTNDTLKVITMKNKNHFANGKRNKNNNVVMVFLLRGPIYLVSITRNGESVNHIRSQLEVYYQHIIFHVSKPILLSVFSKHASYDLRSLLGGTESETEALIDTGTNTPSLLLSCTSSLPLPDSTRKSIAGTISRLTKNPNLIFVLLLAMCNPLDIDMDNNIADSENNENRKKENHMEGNLICEVSKKKQSHLKPVDLILLINFIKNSSTQMKEHEIWSPLCLPGFDDSGHVHTYGTFISNRVCLLLISAESSLEQFHYSSQAKKFIQNELITTKVMDKIEDSISSYYKSFLFGFPSIQKDGIYDFEDGIQHLLFKSNQHQLFVETFGARARFITGKNPQRKWRRHLIRKYGVFRDRLLKGIVNESHIEEEIVKDAKNNQQSINKIDFSQQNRFLSVWEASISQSFVVVHTSAYEFYGTFTPLTSGSQAAKKYLLFCNWIKQESSTIFPTI